MTFSRHCAPPVRILSNCILLVRRAGENYLKRKFSFIKLNENGEKRKEERGRQKEWILLPNRPKIVIEGIKNCFLALAWEGERILFSPRPSSHSHLSSDPDRFSVFQDFILSVTSQRSQVAKRERERWPEGISHYFKKRRKDEKKKKKFFSKFAFALFISALPLKKGTILLAKILIYLFENKGQESFLIRPSIYICPEGFDFFLGWS